MKTKKITVVALVLAMLTLMLQIVPATAFADNMGVGTYCVTAKELSIRSKPSVQNGEKLGSIPNGTNVIVTEISGTWGYTTYEDITGWVSMNYLKFVSNELTVQKNLYIVESDTLNVRVGPGTFYLVLGELKCGDIVEVTKTSDNWSYVIAGELEGWVSSKYLTKHVDSEKDKEATHLKIYTVSKDTVLRTGYNKTFNSRGTVPAGTSIVVDRIKDNYALTSYNGLLGWVSVSDIAYVKDASSKDTLTIDRSKSVFTAGDGAAYAFGVDVSKWQGKTIDWTKVKASGVDFVILRLGTTRGKDSMFEEYYKGAKAVGLDIGGYIYSYSTNVAGAKNDAKLCLKWLEGKIMEYPIYFDIEDKDKQGSNSKSYNADMAMAFVDEMNKNGWYGGIYSGASWWKTTIDYNKISGKYDSWVARYYNGTPSGKYDYASEFGMYQYSSTGVISGINTKVDLDVAYKDYPSIIKAGGYNGYDASSNRNAYTNKIFGDATNDTNVNMEDIVYMQKSVAKIIELSDAEAKLADVNCDGEVTMEDVVSVQLFIAGLKTSFAVG